MTFHLCQCIKGILLMETQELLLGAAACPKGDQSNHSPVLWSPLQGPGWADSECRCPSIYKWDFHPAGEQYQLLCGWGLSAGFVCICLSQGRDSSLGWCLLAVNFKSLLHYFHRWSHWGKFCYSCGRNVTSFQESLFNFLLAYYITLVWF